MQFVRGSRRVYRSDYEPLENLANLPYVANIYPGCFSQVLQLMAVIPAIVGFIFFLVIAVFPKPEDKNENISSLQPIIWGGLILNAVALAANITKILSYFSIEP